jgi:hypothetical protein
MFEFEESLVFYAQKYVSHLLKKKASKEIDDPVWGRKSLDLGKDEYGLIVPKDNKRLAFTFTRGELIKGYGTSEWKERLLAKTNEILRRMERRK